MSTFGSQNRPPRAPQESGGVPTPLPADQHLAVVFEGMHHSPHYRHEIAKDYGAIIEDYADGRTATLATLSAAGEALVALLNPDDADEKLVRDQILFRIGNIDKAVVDYVQTVVQYYRVSGRQVTMETEKWIDLMKRVDGDRRRRHNLLMTALSELHSAFGRARELLEDKEVPVFAAWNGAATEPHPFLVFDRRALEDRDTIRDWAIAHLVFRNTQPAPEE